MIQPTIGRRVWYRPSDYDLGLTENKPSTVMTASDRTQPCDAGIVYVHSDRLVNLSVTDHNGVVHARTSVQLLQYETAPKGVSYAEWMPYQKQAAEKPAAAAADLSAGAVGLAGFIDPQLDAARLFVIAGQTASHEALMKRFDIIYLHADELLDSLERIGVVGPEAGGQRPVLVQA